MSAPILKPGKPYAPLLIAICLAVLLQQCKVKTAEDKAATDSTAQAASPRDSITSFQSLFAPGQYEIFLGKYWTEECYNKWYSVAKALDRKLTCPCEGILPTIQNSDLIISLNNVNCYPPEVEEMNYRVDHSITIPLESLRPYLSETGTRIVFESGSYLQDWLAGQKKAATTVAESPYSLYISVIQSGKGFRIVLQSQAGQNNEEGTITGYFENEGGQQTPVTGYRTWGGFTVFDPKLGAEKGIDFFWEDQSKGDEYHAVRNRFLSATSQSGDPYVEYVKLVGDFTQYEGPEDAYREPENGLPDGQ